MAVLLRGFTVAHLIEVAEGNWKKNSPVLYVVDVPTGPC